jgi:hypothetical protein
MLACPSQPQPPSALQDVTLDVTLGFRRSYVHPGMKRGKILCQEISKALTLQLDLPGFPIPKLILIFPKSSIMCGWGLANILYFLPVISHLTALL